MQMHTRLKCETPHGHGINMYEMFKIDTGADGNLMPITMFVRLFPKLSLKTLGKTVEKELHFFAYNNTLIRQFGVCSVKLSLKGKSAIGKFYVVQHAPRYWV